MIVVSKWHLYALGLLFAGLKLSHQIDWPWWLVLLPTYGMKLAEFTLIAAYGLVWTVGALFAAAGLLGWCLGRKG